MRVLRTIVRVVNAEAGSSMREEVRGPWAATTEPAARMKRRVGLTRMVGRRVEGRGQQKRDMYWEEKAAAKADMT